MSRLAIAAVGRARGRLAVLLLALVLGTPASAPALEAKAADLLARPDEFHKKSVTLYGKVANVQPRTSQKGNAYYTFRLNDTTGGITVFAYGTPPCAAGTVATVDGVFQKMKEVGRAKFQNQVDATSVRC